MEEEDVRGLVLVGLVVGVEVSSDQLLQARTSRRSVAIPAS